MRVIPLSEISIFSLTTEATMLIGALIVFVAMWRLYKLYGPQEWLFPMLSIGLFFLGMLVDVLDEFYRMPVLLEQLVENNAKMFGITFFFIGILSILSNLIKISYTDPLTGIFNRRHLLHILRQELEQAREAGKQYTIAFLDINRFSEINDTMGHDIGDVVLVDVATRLKRAIRNGDTLGRFGGDEFLILMPETELATATVVMDKICNQVSKMRILEGEHRISISYGLAQYPEHGNNSDRLLRIASKRMYDEKRRLVNQSAGQASAGGV